MPAWQASLCGSRGTAGGVGRGAVGTCSRPQNRSVRSCTPGGAARCPRPERDRRQRRWPNASRQLCPDARADACALPGRGVESRGVHAGAVLAWHVLPELDELAGGGGGSATRRRGLPGESPRRSRRARRVFGAGNRGGARGWRNIGHRWRGHSRPRHGGGVLAGSHVRSAEPGHRVRDRHRPGRCDGPATRVLPE